MRGRERLYILMLTFIVVLLFLRRIFWSRRASGRGGGAVLSLCKRGGQLVLVLTEL